MTTLIKRLFLTFQTVLSFCKMTTSSGETAIYIHRDVIWGHHVYKAVWTPTIGERICVQKQPGKDRRAVAVLTSEDTLVGHAPREISKLWHYHLWGHWSEKARKRAWSSMQVQAAWNREVSQEGKAAIEEVASNFKIFPTPAFLKATKLTKSISLSLHCYM